VVCKDIPDYRNLLMEQIVSMPEVEAVETMFVLRTEKRDPRLPLG
jgi:DNA-binding Lrp family transcriptional regulator